MRFSLIILLLGSLLAFPVLSLAVSTPCCEHQMEDGMTMMDEMSLTDHSCCEEADICLESADCECQLQSTSYPSIYSAVSQISPLLVVNTCSLFIPFLTISSPDIPYRPPIIT